MTIISLKQLCRISTFYFSKHGSYPLLGGLDLGSVHCGFSLTNENFDEGIYNFKESGRENLI